MKYLLALAAAALPGVVAFPSLHGSLLSPRDTAQPGCSTSTICDTPLPISNAAIFLDPKNKNAPQVTAEGIDNCGPRAGLCENFNPKEQLVSVTGPNAFQAPSPNDVRGPCPGLNAAANHQYIPRSGLLTVEEAVQGLPKLYGIDPQLTRLLATYALAFDGDIMTGVWSIGGPTMPPASGSFLTPEGISYSHEYFEGDASLTRCDAYVNQGDAHSLSPTRFQTAYEIGMKHNRYTFNKFAQLYAKNLLRSQMQNAFYFVPVFAGLVAPPSMYTFAVNFFSNHSHEIRNGYLGGGTFKTFMAIGGDYPNFTWKPGKERIPNNWYRRPSDSQFTVSDVFSSLNLQYLAYPTSFAFGGNTNGVNSYKEVSVAQYTDGSYNSDTLFESDNLPCFFYTTELQSVPDRLKGGYNAGQSAYNLIKRQLDKNFQSLQCPQISSLDQSVFDQYPGSNYHPTSATDAPSPC